MKGNEEGGGFMKTVEELIKRYGEVVLLEGEGDTRRNRDKKAITYYKSGHIATVALEKELYVETDIGRIPAEYISFYEDGSVKRIFPLDGKINGYWTEENEEELAEKLQFKIKENEFKTKVIGLYFYPSGALKSLTLWPKERIKLLTDHYGVITVRSGVSFYETGEIKSLEPLLPVTVATPIGKVMAYDYGACGINGDLNSLVLDEKGVIQSCITSYHTIEVKDEEGIIYLFKPHISYEEIIPVEISFTKEEAVFNKSHYFNLGTSQFKLSLTQFNLEGGCHSCVSCTGHCQG